MLVTESGSAWVRSDPGAAENPSGAERVGIHRPAIATGPLLIIGAATTVVLLALSPRYGYHRDELYFLAAGRHLAWGYPDQGPLTPLLARVMSAINDHSLLVLRIPSAVIAGVVVVLTGLIAREFEAARVGQLLAAACMAVAGGTLAVTHTLSTTTLDLLCWTVVSYLIVRLLGGADRRWWFGVGVVVGLGLENKWLIAFLAFGMVAGLAIAGPRRVFSAPQFWLAGLIAVLIWAPNLIWQGRHGWPQFELSKAIAAGGSTSSQPWYLFIPLELVFMSPVLVPIWGIGWWRLLRAPQLRVFRSFGWAYLLLALIFLATGGKPYYLLGLYPVLFAAGAEPVVAWARRSSGRRTLLTAALALSLVVDAIITLPVLPAGWLEPSPVLALNPDAGETVGWRAFVETVAQVDRTAPAGTVVLMGNYGEAGAVDRFGPASGLPAAYSGHNGYGLWGPPPDTAAGSAVVVGISESTLRQWFGSVIPKATIDNGVDLDNDEQGNTVWLCTRQRDPWSRLWSSVRHLG